MPITHHPPDDTVLRYANGTLPEAPAIVVATHLSFCPACRHRMESYEMLGGSMLDDVAPAESVAGCVVATLARLDTAPAAAILGSGPNAGAATASAAGTIAAGAVAGEAAGLDRIGSGTPSRRADSGQTCRPAWSGLQRCVTTTSPAGASCCRA